MSPCCRLNWFSESAYHFITTQSSSSCILSSEGKMSACLSIFSCWDPCSPALVSSLSPDCNTGARLSLFVHSNGVETLLGRITAQRVISRMVGQRPPLLLPRLVTAVSCASAGECAPSEALGKLVTVPQCQQQLCGVQKLKWKHITSHRQK